MRASWVVAALLLGCQPSAPASDAGTDASAGCGLLTAAGYCEGSIARYCLDGEPTAIDCGAIGPAVACGELPDWGADCVVDDGDACAFTLPDGVVSLTCREAGSGCIWSDRGQSCEPSIGACTPEEVGTCRGDLAIFQCRGGRPVANDCASWGGRCASAVCVDMPAGAPCDGTNAVCEAGLSCVDGTCGGGGSASLRVVIGEGALRDERLAGGDVHLYPSQPRWFVGDRPSDVPEPIATRALVDWAALFEGLAPGRYWYDFSWIASTGRLAYGVGEVDVPGPGTEVTADWRYVGPESSDYEIYDVADAMAVLTVFTSDSILETEPLMHGLDVRVEDIGLLDPGERITRASSGAGRCGEPLANEHAVILLPAGTYSVGGRAIRADGQGIVWRERSVTLGDGECRMLDLGTHDCNGCF